MPKPVPNPRRPLTVGFLVDALGESYQWAILQGALDAARDRGANLLCFEGGAFGTGASGPLPANRPGAVPDMLSLIGNEAVDGLVVLAGALGNEVGWEAMRTICERFRPLPMCFVGLDVPGFSSVSVDNHVGARAVLGHLVVHHGMRRVAFVRGPEANAEAERRFAAYREVLAGASVPFDPALVASGDFTTEAGRRAVACFLDERAKATSDLEAIACANDAIALGVLEALERRGIRVPEQLAVVGFDDVEEARFTTPPLTTVRQPLRRQGREAVRMVLAPTDEEKLVLGTELRVRRSCGCFSQRAAAVPPSQTPALGMEAMIMARREVMVADLARAARGTFSAAGTGWEGRLVAAFTAEVSSTRGAVAHRPVLPVGVNRPVRSPASGAGFVETYDDILNRLVAAGIDPAVCYDVVATLRRHLLRCVGSDRRERALTEDLLEQVGELTGSVMEHAQAWQRFEAQRRARVLGRGAALMTAALEQGDLSRAVGDHLSPLGIESCYLAILDPPNPARSGRTARLVLAYEADDRAARPAALAYRAEEILPYAAMTTGRQAAWVVAELGSTEGEQALLIVDLGQPEGHAYEALRHIFGAVFAGARLGESLRAERAARLEDQRSLASLSSARDAVAAAVDRCRALSEARGHADVELGAVEGLLQAAQHDLERLLTRS
jgi:DNA-binding LacI/PurR family transcriptional regulator/CheY-like chemotaxis protein